MAKNKRDELGQNSVFSRPGETPSLHDATGWMLKGQPQQTTPEVVEVVPDGAIIPQDDGTWAAGNVQLTAVGLAVDGNVTETQWMQIGVFLQQMQGSIQWLIGDWIVGCQQLWGDAYQQVVEQTGYEYTTVANYAYVARNVPLSLRSDKLKFGHYQLLASLPVEEQRQWAAIAIQESMSIALLRQAMKQKPTPLSSTVEVAGAQKTLISREKPREFRQFLKLASRAGQGDAKAKQRALGQIVQYRQWLDDMEEWLKG